MLMNERSPVRMMLLSAVLLTLTAACSSKSGRALEARSLPPVQSAGDLARTVDFPAPMASEGNVRISLAKAEKSLVEANNRILGFCRWYVQIRASYEAGKPAQVVDQGCR